MDWDAHHKNAWSLLIGRAILAFGDIESVTLTCLSELPSDQIAQAVSSLRFAKRVDLIIAVIDSRNLGDAGAKLKRLLNDAKNEAVMRNLIAHNPLALEIYTKGSAETEYRHVIVSNNEKKIIGYDDLEKFVNRVERLADDILHAWAEVSQQA